MGMARVSSDRLGNEGVGSLLLRLSLPLSLSMLFQGLYNLVDSIYISRLGEEALTAMSLSALPQYFVSMMAAGMSVGMNAVISGALGDRDRDKAQAAFRGGFLLELLLAAMTAGFGFFGCRWFFGRFLSDGRVIALGSEYLGICLGFGLFSFLQVLGERVLQSVGLNRLSMVSQCCGALCNMILDPLLIFGIGGRGALGMKGAAAATVFSQLLAFCISVFLNLKFNKEIMILDNPLEVDLPVLGEIVRIGLPAVLMAVVNFVMDYVINKILAGFSGLVVASYGVYSKLQRFIQIPTAGLSGSMVTVISYNYGAKKSERVRQGLKWGMILYGIGYGAAAVLFVFFPRYLLTPFRPTKEMVRICLPAFHIIGLTFLLSIINAPCSSFFQSVKRPSYSLFLIFFRQLIVRVPIALLLAGAGNVDLVWWCWPVSELASAIASLYLVRRVGETDVILRR